MAKDKEKETQVEEAAIPDEDSVAAQLKRLGADLIAAAEDEAGSKATLKQIENLLGNLKLKDYPQLAESEVVQTILGMMGTQSLRPGEVVSRGTLAERDREWTWRDVQERVLSREFPLKTFVPSETLVLTWNGLQLQVIANEEVQVPAPFYDIYRERQFAKTQAVKNEHYMMGLSDEPPHYNWQTPEGAVVRAMSIEARKYGRMGGSIGVGPLLDFEPTEGGQENG